MRMSHNSHAIGTVSTNAMKESSFIHSTETVIDSTELMLFTKPDALELTIKIETILTNTETAMLKTIMTTMIESVQAKITLALETVTTWPVLKLKTVASAIVN